MTGINNHEGRKYLRKIVSAVDGSSVEVDVYAVLAAFGVTCPATQHAVKKLLCAGGRGKGDKVADLVGALAAVNRAIEMAKQDAEDKAVEPSEPQMVPPYHYLNASGRVECTGRPPKGDTCYAIDLDAVTCALCREFVKSPAPVRKSQSGNHFARENGEPLCGYTRRLDEGDITLTGLADAVTCNTCLSIMGRVTKGVIGEQAKGIPHGLYHMTDTSGHAPTSLCGSLRTGDLLCQIPSLINCEGCLTKMKETSK